MITGCSLLGLLYFLKKGTIKASFFRRLKVRTGYAFNAFGAETYGALGEQAKHFIRNLVTEAGADACPIANLYDGSASKYTKSVRRWGFTY